ncbi:CshA/CshB family fibrillar adhesin-related protein [Glycomyces buryatensis]|nr:CshA/CshB family fibrillar adhesin-related protein [Glycomyces buryatensis]
MLAGLLAASAVAVAQAANPPASAQPSEQADANGCGFGTGGPNAETICWIDMSSFDFTQATTTGQDMEIDLGGGITIEFTLNLAPGDDGLRPVDATPVPTWSGAVIGNHAYLDTPGSPAFYQQTGDATSSGFSLNRFTMDNITVSRNGVTTTSGYSFVMADAESTNGGEGFTYTSSDPLVSLAQITPDGFHEACNQELTGLGTTSVTCRGSEPRGGAGVLVVTTEDPTEVGVELLNRNGIAGSRQGVMFGVMIAMVDVGKTVENRASDSDNFRVQAVDDSDGSVVASAETGSADSAESGPQPILTSVAGNQVVFSETMTGDSGPDVYDRSWTCTRNGTEVDPAEITGDPTSESVELTVNTGDLVECDVTNTGPEPVDPGDGGGGYDGDPAGADGGELPQTGNGWIPIAALTGLALAVIGIVLARRVTRKVW